MPFLSEMKNVDGSYRLEKLSKISRLILAVPHSNAEEKRIFSMARKNKTYFRPNLDPEETLGSLITVKLAKENEPIYKTSYHKRYLIRQRKPLKSKTNPLFRNIRFIIK